MQHSLTHWNVLIKFLLIICISLLSHYSADGQLHSFHSSMIEAASDYMVFKKDINDGLSQNIVISLEVDSAGILWLGTLDGINKFDGHEFEIVSNYHPKMGPANDYYSIWSSSKNNIYTKRDDGIHLFNLRNKSWSQDSIMRRATGMVMDSDNQPLFVSNNVELFGSQPQKKSNFKNCEKPESLSNPVLCKDKEGTSTYILYTEGYLYKFNTDWECENFIDISSTANAFIDIEWVDGELWCVSNNGQFITVNSTLEEYKQHDIFSAWSVERLTDIAVHENRVILCADQQGIFEYDTQSKRWKHRMIHLLYDPQAEHEYIIRAELDENRIYFGSTTNGLLIYDPSQIRFQRIPEKELFEGKIIDLKLPRKIVQIGDDIWISTTGQGLWRYSIIEKKIKHYSVESHPYMLQSNSIRQIAHINDDLWLGYNGSGIDIIDVDREKIKRTISLPRDSMPENIVINDFFQDSTGTVWCGTEYHGVYAITKNNVQHFHSRNSGLEYNRIYNINEINSEIIFSNFRGISYVLDPSTRIFTRKETPYEDFSISIKTIFQDSDQNIWIGTGGQGVLLLDNEWNILDTFSIATSDLLSDELCIILEGENGDIWAGSNKGLALFQKSENRWSRTKLLLQEDGLLSNEFMTGAYLKDDKNQIWMGTIEGVNFWNSANVFSQKIKYPLYLTSFYADQEGMTNLFQENGYLGSFSHRVENFNFEYSSIGFQDQNNVKYRVKLEGFDKNWREQGNRNFISYNNLRGGDYEFIVQSTDSAGEWNPTLYKWTFKVESSLWGKWWFYLILLGIASFLTVLIARAYSSYKLRKEARKMEQERELLLMEMKALRAQINPHFLFNTLSSINNFILKNEKNIASIYLTKFAKLIRLILNYNSRRFISIAEELAALELYIELEKMRLGGDLEYFLNTNISESLENISIPPLILQPFVENAIWNGLMPKTEDKILEISITSAPENMIHISIKDNGIGREASAQRRSSQKTRSFGMEITERRLEIWLNKLMEEKIEPKIVDLYYEDGNPKGTQVLIKIPFIRYSKVDIEKV